MFDRFTMEARKVMKAAREAAINGGYISTRHLLIGLSQVEGKSRTVLNLVGLTEDKLKAESKKYDTGNTLRVGVIPFTKNAKRAIEKTVEVAAARKDNYIGPMHLLVGLCRTKGTSAQKVARSIITAEEVDKIIESLKKSEKSEPEKYQSPFTGEWV